MRDLQRVLLYLSVLFLSTCGDQEQNITSTSKLNMTIFYESLCPDSYNFILGQLVPVWETLNKYIHVTFVPFGKSSSLENGTKFICQHGSAECKGNRIMSCALSKMPQHMQVSYVACFMRIYYRAGRLNSNEFGEKCAENNFDEILECYQSKEGTRRQLQAEVVTNTIIGKKSNFIPTIFYNDEYSQELQDHSLKNLYGVVCHILEQTYPGVCQYKRNIK